MPLFPRILIVPSARATEVAAALSGWPGFSLHPSSLRPPPFPSLPLPLDVALACAKLRAINVATSEFFVNSQAVCLSLPMIRSLRCLRNAKGPIAVQLCRGFEPSFLVVVNVPHVYAPLALLSRDFRVRAYRSSRLSEPEASQRGALIFRRVI